MPIYEYNCPDCGNDQESLVKSTDDKPLCEKCGGESLKRKLSVFAVSTVSSSQECACAAGGCAGPDMAHGCMHGGGCG